MRWKRTIQLLDVHAEGEIGKVAIGGVPKIPGNTVAEQLNWLNTDPKGQELRRFLCLEPRGAPIGSVNLLLPPKHPDADADAFDQAGDVARVREAVEVVFGQDVWVWRGERGGAAAVFRHQPTGQHLGSHRPAHA